MHGDQNFETMQAWCDYEIASLRKLGSTGPSGAQAPEEAPPGARKMFDKSKLVWRHILASLNGLKSGLKLGSTIGQGETAGLPHLQKEGAASSHPIQFNIAAVVRCIAMIHANHHCIEDCHARTSMAVG